MPRTPRVKAALNSKCFFALVKSIIPLQQEVNVTFDLEGMEISALDTTNCVFIRLKIPSDSFEEYVLKDGVATTVGWDLRVVNKNVKPIGGDTICFQYFQDEAPNDFEFVQWTGDGGVESRFSMKLLCIESDTMNVPDAEDSDMDLIANFDSHMLSTTSPIGRLMDVASGTVQISYDGSEMEFIVESSSGSGKVVINKSVTDPKLCTLSGAGSGDRMSFSTTFLSKFLQASGIGDRVNLRMQAQNPIRVEFPFLKSAHLHFILAPRLGEDSASAMES